MNRIHEMLQVSSQITPQSLALIDPNGRPLTYHELMQAVDQAQAALVRFDVRAGDRVMIIGENSVEMIAFLFACSRLDAWAIPSNARMSALELDRIAKHAAVRTIVTTDGVSLNAVQHAARLGANPATGGFGSVSISDARPCEVEPTSPSAAEQVAVLMYTTGTTGDPKGVMITHANLLFAANASATVRSLKVEDLVYCALPFSHIFGLASALLASLSVGAGLQLQTRFTAESLYEALKSGVTVLPAVPQMHALLMEFVREKGLDKLKAPQLRYVSSGAAPLDPAWKRRAEAFYGVAVQNGYGMTETTAGISTTSFEIGNPNISTGKPLDGTEAKVVSAPDQDDLQEGVGEILVRGPHVMKGYYKNPAETAKVHRADGFLHTGDLGRFDEDGNLEVVGRCKELIISGGFNIYPPEVEAALNDHPAIIQAAVVGRKLEGGNEEVLAFAQVADLESISKFALKEHLMSRLAPYKHPAQIVFTMALPAASTGKILKHKLIETFQDDLESECTKQPV
ncbi:AMP-binding protein [Pseudovibrio japonicus]|uniref:AMP-binding protein n=1 Tax=Pseudovibrio japonicus TaxID=366534 RepID=A0ABQ3DXB7_9HYPH|nr:class I adenylate-forming enzyme family protein [Pseudovibrio japonicus]GHB16883.1 AMP-binding protein [Pseudovibrio japonicus]